ncbi:MAG TPA: hypothetical protein VFN74_01775 [Chloroflexota bacterium]|nr:hypothetical protein [Chloroflexota bacterium]
MLAQTGIGVAGVGALVGCDMGTAAPTVCVATWGALGASRR